MLYIIADFSISTTRQTIKKLQSDFKSMVMSLKLALIDRDKSGDLKYDDFREDFIYDLPESTRDQSQLYIEKKRKEIFNSSDYNELFVVLNACWDYLNPFLLQHLLNYGGEQLRSEMDEYLINYELFMKSTTIDDFLEALPNSHKRSLTRTPPLGLQEVLTKHELPVPGLTTLQCIEDIRLELGESMRLTRFSLYIAKFSRGSVIITWFVTAKVAEMLAELEQHENFEIVRG